jgi:hypothetical protein
MRNRLLIHLGSCVVPPGALKRGPRLFFFLFQWHGILLDDDKNKLVFLSPHKNTLTQCPRRFLRMISQNPSVPKSNRLLVVIWYFGFCLLIAHPHLLMRATSEHFLLAGSTFRHGLVSELEPLIATSTGTHRSVLIYTNKCGWTIIWGTFCSFFLK